MADMLFYHLERDPLDKVLPALLEKSLARGWRCLVQAGSQERAEMLDNWLWTYRDDSFLPHGLAADGEADLQPIVITAGTSDAFDGNVCFFVDGAKPREAGEFERLVYMFDGHDEGAIADARTCWKWAKSAGLAVTYWQQDDRGRWLQKA